MINPSAPGLKTTELWVSVLSMVLTFLAIRGVITVGQINPILDAFTQIYGGAIGLITIFAIARAYIQSRTAIKTTLIQQQGNLPIESAK